MFAGDRDGSVTTLAGGAVLVAAAVCFAAGAVYIERVVPEMPGLGLATAAMVVTTVARVRFAVAAEPEWPSRGTLAWLVLLGVVATGGALVLFYGPIVDLGAVRANLAGYLAPGFAVGYGVLLLDDHVGVLDLVGWSGSSWARTSRSEHAEFAARTRGASEAFVGRDQGAP